MHPRCKEHDTDGGTFQEIDSGAESLVTEGGKWAGHCLPGGAQGPPYFECTKDGLALQGRPHLETGFIRKGHTQQVQLGLTGWHIILSSLSARMMQPWDERLLGLQGWDCSPGP